MSSMPFTNLKIFDCFMKERKKKEGTYKKDYQEKLQRFNNLVKQLWSGFKPR